MCHQSLPGSCYSFFRLVLALRQLVYSRESHAGLSVIPFPLDSHLFGTGYHPAIPQDASSSLAEMAETPWWCQNWGPGVQITGQYL